jgi:hypothetical protein
MTSEQKTPPWVWDGLSDDLHEETWRRFAEWVSWLTEAYEPWVVLPDCWSVHEGLRVELSMFWYWHRVLMTASVNPVDGVRWHAELRRAAGSWRELAGCQHEPPIRHSQALAEQRRTRTAQFLAVASARPKGASQ